MSPHTTRSLRRRLAASALHTLTMAALVTLAIACGPARGGGGGGGGDDCQDDTDCRRTEYCDIAIGDEEGECRDLGGGVGSACDNSSDCSGDLRCLSGMNICVKTCQDALECGGAECVEVEGANVGYCDLTAGNNTQNNTQNNTSNNAQNNTSNNAQNNASNNAQNNTGSCIDDPGLCGPAEECCEGTCVLRGECGGNNDDGRCTVDDDCSGAQECCDGFCAPFGSCEPCGGRCGFDEQCVNDTCVPNQTTCEFEGQDCDETTQSTDTLVCFAGDSTDPASTTCHATCTDTVNHTDCTSGSWCVELQDEFGDPAGSVCISSNCTSPANSAAECGAINGTCFPGPNDSYYCNEGGFGSAGTSCTEQLDCASGLACILEECQPFCTLNNNNTTCPDSLDCLDLIDDDTWGTCGDGCSGFESNDAECSTGEGCLPLSTDTGFCTEVGDTPVREVCDGDSDTPQCEPLSTCLGIAANLDATCAPYCDLTAANPEANCVEDEVCIPAFNSIEATGVCALGCDPTSATNACEGQAGVENCLPFGAADRGVCLDSGDTPPGDDCNLIDDSVFGDCTDNSACYPNDFDNESPTAPGVCQELCPTFSSVGDYDSGCPDGEVCEIFGADWGMCTDDVVDPPLAPFDPCFSSGQWCADDSLCIEVDGQGNAVCLQLCRLGEDDCATITQSGTPTTCQEIFSSETLGGCLP